jgi:hypothetical protein
MSEHLVEAILLTLQDLGIGLFVVVLIGGLVSLIAHAQKDLPERVRPEPVEPVDFGEEIRVYDRSRRGPEVLAGPEDRDRLPMTGRRVA